MDVEEQTAARPTTVVVVDDDAGLRSLYAHVLDHDADFVVVGQAVDGLDGVVVARRRQPDVVLLDLLMPVMDGLVAVPLIKDASPASKVVMLSSLPGTEVVTAALGAGADAFVPKVLPLASLLTHLRDAVR